MNISQSRSGRGFVSTLLVGAFALTSVAMASGCRHSPEERAEKVSRHISSKLDLNDAQKAEFKKMTDEAIADFRSMSSNRKEVASEVEKQLAAQKADPTALKVLVAANDVKRQELMAKWIDRAAEFQSRLTPEQKQKALKMMQKFRERFEGRFE
jgi:Spy/CpxP family protein refolding chaperone